MEKKELKELKKQTKKLLELIPKVDINDSSKYMQSIYEDIEEIKQSIDMKINKIMYG